MSIFIQLSKQRIYESILLNLILSWLIAIFFCLIYFINTKTASKYLAFAHRTTRSKKLKIWIESFALKDLSAFHYQPPNKEINWQEIFGGRIMVLKAPNKHEKGIIIIKFSELMSRIAYSIDLHKIMQDYSLVFEPSWSGYFDKDILYYTQFADDIFMLAAEEDDARFLQKLNSNLIPVPLGPCDWVNPTISEAYLTDNKQYDIVMNSHWGSHKRHYVFFQALKKLDPNLKVALIGMRWHDGNLDKVQRLAKYFGVFDQIEFYEHIPYSQVMEIVCRSKISILMSLKEGSNRAIAESMFCNIPVLVLDEHVGGIKKNIVSATGQLTKQSTLAMTISSMLKNVNNYSPRLWAVDNISCYKSSAILESTIKTRRKKQNSSWTGKLAIRANSPELNYLNDSDKEFFKSYNQDLMKYLRPA